MDTGDIRRHTRETVRKLGYPDPKTLPLIDSNVSCRSPQDVVERLLVLNCVAAIAYGFPASRGRGWLQQEHLEGALSSRESAFVMHGRAEPEEFQLQVEALWALTWVIGLVPDLDFTLSCRGDFVAMLPDLQRNESGELIRGKAALRSERELLSALDLAYCLHWGEREASRNWWPRRRPPLPGIRQRRHALEWVLSSQDWDAVVLDT